MSDAPGAVVSRRPSRRRALAIVAAAAALLAGYDVYRSRASKTDPMLTTFEPHPSPRVLGPLRFTDEAGRERSLASLRGRVVLLNVWATWCAPCRQEMPTLDRLQATLGGPMFEVVTVSIDAEGLPVVQTFFKQIGVKHLHPYVDSFRELIGLGATGIPLTLLIDREGREVGRKRGHGTWDDPKVVQTIRGYLATEKKP